MSEDNARVFWFGSADGAKCGESCRGEFYILFIFPVVFVSNAFDAEFFKEPCFERIDGINIRLPYIEKDRFDFARILPGRIGKASGTIDDGDAIFSFHFRKSQSEWMFCFCIHGRKKDLPIRPQAFRILNRFREKGADNNGSFGFLLIDGRSQNPLQHSPNSTSLFPGFMRYMNNRFFATQISPPVLNRVDLNSIQL